MLLDVILVSTRPGRAGEPIGKWFFERAKKHAKFELKLVDLKEANLPLLDEPKHPRLRQYEHAHTKAWSETIAAADAFVFVTPEYNFSLPPTLVNAIDYLFVEWNYKPAAFVSYGGASGGLRSAQMSKLLLTSVKMMPIPEAVAIPFFATMMENGEFKGNEAIEKAITPMLDELHRWATALKTMRP
jgi:NAD(P)H-dependent FMN reductase